MEEITLKLEPTSKQYAAWQAWLDKETRFVFFGGGAGGGKSWWICEKRIVFAYQYPGHKSFIGRKELKRLMGSTFLTFNKVAQHHGIPRDDWKLNGQYNYIEFKNGSRIDLLDVDYLPSDPLYERFGSLEYTDGDLEECGEINFLAFDVLKSRVGRHMNKEFGLLPKIGMTGNPSKNWTYQAIYKPWREHKLPPEYAFIQSLYKDNPYTADEYGKQLNQITDKSTRERLMFGNWEYEDDPSALLEYDAIIDLFTNSVPASYEFFITADIARYGGDKIVIYVWQGWKIVEIVWTVKQGLDKTIQAIRDIAFKRDIPRSRICVDEDGVGGGVVDALPGIKGFIANSSPLPNPVNPSEKQNYKNLKAQCSYLFASLVNKRAVAVSTEDAQVRAWIIEECEQLKAKDLDKDGKVQVIPKEDVKERLGRSPDFLDALVMRMYFELSKQTITTAQTFNPQFTHRAT